MANEVTMKKASTRNGDVMVVFHSHDGFGFHWASARHPKNPTAHADSKVDKARWIGTPNAKAYADALGRKVVFQIPSKGAAVKAAAEAAAAKKEADRVARLARAAAKKAAAQPAELSA